MPDALAKTVPIWCAVVNRALFPDQPAMHAVQFPPNYLGASEESEIEKRIDGFVKSMKVCKRGQRRLPQPGACRVRLTIRRGSQFKSRRSPHRAGEAHEDHLGPPIRLAPSRPAGGRRSQHLGAVLRLQTSSWRGDVRGRLHSRRGR